MDTLIRMHSNSMYPTQIWESVRGNGAMQSGPVVG